MKTILHLCADIGSDSVIYSDNGYEVIKIGKDIGVENYSPDKSIYGVIANPVCTDFSVAKNSNRDVNINDSLFLVKHCERIISECNPNFWVIENPATGRMKEYLGVPTYQYEPWWFGSPWTKRTALWGKFNIPERIYFNWEDVPKNDKIYVRPGRKASLVWLHKKAINDIPEFLRFASLVHDDMSLRSLCSQKFAEAFFQVNK